MVCSSPLMTETMTDTVALTVLQHMMVLGGTMVVTIQTLMGCTSVGKATIMVLYGSISMLLHIAHAHFAIQTWSCVEVTKVWPHCHPKNLIAFALVHSSHHSCTLCQMCYLQQPIAAHSHEPTASFSVHTEKLNLYLFQSTNIAHIVKFPTFHSCSS